jgi:hypothetical protein
MARKWIVLSLLLASVMFFCPVAFAQQSVTVTYGSQNYVITLHNGDLQCRGGGYGKWGMNQVRVSLGVDQFWAAASWSGPAIVYQKGNVYYAAILQHDTGNAAINQKIYQGKDVQGVAVNGRTYGAHIYINRTNNRPVVTWSIWWHPNLPAKIQEGIVN